MEILNSIVAVFLMLWPLDSYLQNFLATPAVIRKLEKLAVAKEISDLQISEFADRYEQYGKIRAKQKKHKHEADKSKKPRMPDADADEEADKLREPYYYGPYIPSKTTYGYESGVATWEEGAVKAARELRDRYYQYADAPYIWERQRLPPLAMLNTMKEQNEAYRNLLVLRIESHLYQPQEVEYMQQAIDEAVELHAVLTAIAARLCTTDDMIYQRRMLRELRDDIMGPENYYKVILPPAVPTWRLPKLD